MPERDIQEIPLLPPKRWHDGIRNNIPGNMMNESVFMSFSIKVTDVFNLIVLSITSNKETLPQGIYLLTNINQENISELPYIIRPMVEPIRQAILNEPDTGDQLFSIPQEIDKEMSAAGGKINMANTIGMSVVGVTGAGGLIFSLKPQTLENIKQNFRKTNI